MMHKILNWFRTPVRQDVRELENKLLDRCSAEIAARLLRRAELHAKSTDYLRACAVLDRVAADNMRRLEIKAGSDMSVWLDRRDLCLRILREGKK